MRKFIIIPADKISEINFAEVEETSADTLRYTLDKTKTFIKYSTAEMPESIQAIQGRSKPYTYEEFLNILQTPQWAYVIYPEKQE